MKKPSDRRPPIVVAAQWASRVITIAAEMVVPIVLGLFVDRWLGTLVVFTAIGGALGLTVGVWHLMQIGKPSGDR